jgi:hypothetical protein
MGNEQANGPYFLGQKSEACGHYYPDVLLFADTINDKEEVLSLTYCFKCDKILYRKWNVETVDSSFRENLKKKGWEVHATLEELARIREQKLNEFLTRSDS